VIAKKKCLKLFSKRKRENERGWREPIEGAG
jgi:hypothetical protein